MKIPLELFKIYIFNILFKADNNFNIKCKMHTKTRKYVEIKLVAYFLTFKNMMSKKQNHMTN